MHADQTALLDELAEFFHSHDMLSVNRTLRDLLLFYIASKIRIGYPVEFMQNLPAIIDLLQLLDKTIPFSDVQGRDTPP